VRARGGLWTGDVQDHWVLKLARMLADLAGEDEIGPRHVAEAVQYRMLDRGEG